MRARAARSRATVLAAVFASVAGCSLLVDLGDFAGGEDASDPAAEGGTDAPAERDEPMADAAADAGDAGSVEDASPDGLLSRDSFEDDDECRPWGPVNAKLERVAGGIAGAHACSVCIETDGVAAFLRRRYAAGPRTYRVNAWVKRVDGAVTDWRVRFVARWEDGGTSDHYRSGPLTTDDWAEIEAARSFGPGLAEVDVRLWFGQSYQPGACLLVDDVRVRRDP